MILKELITNFHLILEKKVVGIDFEMKKTRIEFISILNT